MAEPKVRFKRDDGSSYPAWKEYSISDLFTKIGNKNKDGQNTNVITNSAEFGLIPQRDYFDKDIAVEGNTGNYTIIQTGDFVYNPRKSSYAPMGPFNCYRLEADGIVSPLYICLRPKGVLNPEYLLWYFQTDKWYGYVKDHGAQNGARHDRVGMTDKILMGIPVSAPCEEEQQKIADFLSSIDEVITTSEEEVANLEMQKKTAMKMVFSQKVRFKRADRSDYPEWEEKPFYDCVDICAIVIDPASVSLCLQKEFLLQCILHGAYPQQKEAPTPPKNWGAGIPHYTTEDLMTPGQIYDFAIEAVINHDPMLKQGYSLVSGCAYPSAIPSLIYRKNDSFYFILIKGYIAVDEPELTTAEYNELKALGKKYGAMCYWAPVGFASTDPARFEAHLALKGDGFYCKYTGLRGITDN